LEAGGGTLLLDAGGSVAHRMAQEGLDWAALDAIWISHFHLDHVGGLAPMLFGTRHAPQTRDRRKPLRIYGAHGLRRLWQAFDEAGAYKLTEQPFPVEVREVAAGEPFEILPRLRAETFSTPHTNESLALRLTDRDDGASVVYTSDTGYTEALADFARGAHLFIMECSFPSDKPVATHLELADAMRLARRAAPRRVMLAHLYPEWDALDLQTEARKLWDGETIEARDGLRLEINAEE
jgi:ribonuclease BN (tRNA processing enzyme)